MSDKLFKLGRRFGSDVPGLRGLYTKLDEARIENDLLRARLGELVERTQVLPQAYAEAVAAREAAIAERERAYRQRDTVIEERDTLLDIRAKLTKERDEALSTLAWAQPTAKELTPPPEKPLDPDAFERVAFRCNICGDFNLAPLLRLQNERSSCRTCGSSVRFRAIVHLVSVAVYGESIPLPNMPENRAITGAGLSDWPGYAEPLAAIFDYRNTFFHQEPKLDITAPAPAMLGSLDFLISTEVFEHIPQPIARAFTGAYDLLKPGGHFIFTVPYRPAGKTVEHYPELVDFSVVQLDGRYSLVGLDTSGVVTVHPDPVFHGGDGQTVEMRVFAKTDVIAHLQEAGFVDIDVLEDPVPEFGLYFPRKWSLPILARKPLS